MKRAEIAHHLHAIYIDLAANDDVDKVEWIAEERARLEAEGLSPEEMLERLVEANVQTRFIIREWRQQIMALNRTEDLIATIIDFNRARGAGGGRERQRRRFAIPAAKAREIAWGEWRSGNHPTKDDAAAACHEALGRDWQTVRDWLKEPRAANRQTE